MKAPLSYVPALAPALGLIAGILLFTAGASGWAAAVVGGVGLAVMVVWRHWWSAAGVAAATGWAVAALAAPNQSPQGLFCGRHVAMSAVVRGVSASERATSLIVAVDSVGAGAAELVGVPPFNMLLSTTPDWMPPLQGQRIAFTAVPEPVEVADSAGVFADRSLYYLTHGITATAWLASDDLRPVNAPGGLSGWMARRKADVIHRLAMAGLSPEAFALTAALLTGDTDDLSPHVTANFRAAGVAHALALSGFHVGAVATIVMLLLFPLRAFYRLRPWIAGATVLAVWGFTMLVGMPDSAVRAAIMLSVYCLAVMLGRESNSYNSLCVAVLIILAFRPYSLFSAGFQLSVGAVAGMLVFARALNPVDPRHAVLFKVAQMGAVSVAAMLGTLPVVIACFHALPLLFIVGNLLILWILPLLMGGGILLVAASAAGLHAVWLEWLMNLLARYAEAVTSALASTKALTLDGLYPTSAQIALCAAAVAGVALAVHLLGRWRIGAVAATLALCLAVPLARGAGRPESEAFVIKRGKNVTVVVRHRATAVAIPLKDSAYRAYEARQLSHTLDDYLSRNRVDTLRFTTGDFDLGPFTRRGDVLTFGQHKIQIAGEPADSVGAGSAPWHPVGAAMNSDGSFPLF